MSESSVEPTRVGPIVGGNLRASDADREKVATVLSTAYAEGRITREEHDERLDQVMAARTFDDLVPITHDLVLAPTAVPPRPVVETASTFTIEATNASPEVDRMVAVFGGVTRKGRWRIRRHSQSIAVFGGIDLDLREAVFEAGTVEISGIWMFGSLDIKVPAGIEVRDQTAGIFGGTEVNNVGEPLPGAPTLVIKGVAIFGGVQVSGPKPEKRKRSRHRELH